MSTSKKFSEFDLTKVGQEVQLVGGIWAGEDKTFLFYFPEYGPTRVRLSANMSETPYPYEVEAGHEDWKALMTQSDMVETEVMLKAENGDLVKGIIRKCQRTVDQAVTWNVFRRDGFRCRYCANDKVPMTIDHLVLWEDGGPTIEANLLTSCRKCNKTRGRKTYGEWMFDRYFREVSANLSDDERVALRMIEGTLPGIPRVYNIKSRK